MTSKQIKAIFDGMLFDGSRRDLIARRMVVEAIKADLRLSKGERNRLIMEACK